ncbi:hypothetical protein AA19596_1794 [Acetobacter fabarum DSM 19596]|nr:hypothetical protein AA19596_1794 [Acetobacter fabarum DSM 19596]
MAAGGARGWFGHKPWGYGAGSQYMFLRIALAYLCQRTYNASPRRGARAVEWGGLENRCASNRT